MSYFSVGNGKNTFVFLHGWGSDATAFFFAMKQLCAKYRVVALDFFGFGQSDFPPDYYDVAHYANDVAKLLEILDIETATFWDTPSAAESQSNLLHFIRKSSNESCL